MVPADAPVGMFPAEWLYRRPAVTSGLPLSDEALVLVCEAHNPRGTGFNRRRSRAIPRRISGKVTGAKRAWVCSATVILPILTSAHALRTGPLPFHFDYPDNLL